MSNEDDSRADCTAGEARTPAIACDRLIAQALCAVTGHARQTGDRQSIAKARVLHALLATSVQGDDSALETLEDTALRQLERMRTGSGNAVEFGNAGTFETDITFGDRLPLTDNFATRPNRRGRSPASTLPRHAETLAARLEKVRVDLDRATYAAGRDPLEAIDAHAARLAVRAVDSIRAGALLEALLPNQLPTRSDPATSTEAIQRVSQRFGQLLVRTKRPDGERLVVAALQELGVAKAIAEGLFDAKRKRRPT